MKHWVEEESEAIVDRFIADDAPDDMLRLQNVIAVALLKAWEKGRNQHHEAM